jgi:hypothetical protein
MERDTEIPDVVRSVTRACCHQERLLAPLPARATDEIQVYNADIAEVGQWTIEQHLNDAFEGRTQPDVRGGLIPNHSLNGTPEFAYGVTDRWEAGFYLPFAVSDNQFLSNGAKIRQLFVVPNVEKRDFFYGVNFELGYNLPRFSQQIYALEIRPIIGWRNKDWEFIVNPIVDMSFGSGGETDFAPAVRLVRNLGNDGFVGGEYYADFGQIADVLPLQEQSHTVFAVTDFKVGVVDVELGLGYGLTSGSDRLIAKSIIGYAFPVPGASDKDSGNVKSAMAALYNPLAHAFASEPWAMR